jgi:ABC-2 type transport system ATP-binding protein
MFARVDNSVEFSRGMFGCPPSKARIEEVLRSLSLWDKRESKIRELSGGMKRRVMIAKALSHDPELLFLDEPTAGVDVELRRDMWKQIGALRDRGTTIILTTHYIEEAQEMADRVGVINKGKLLLVDDTHAIMAKLGRTEARISLSAPLAALPASLAGFAVTLEDDGRTLVYRGGDGTGKGKREAAEVIRAIVADDIGFESIVTRESSLEDIFVDLLENREGAPA